MATTGLKKSKKQIDPNESLKREIRFWLKRVDNHEFLKAVRALARHEAISPHVVSFDSLHPELKKAIEEADRDIAEGRIYTSEEVFREIDEWLEKS